MGIHRFPLISNIQAAIPCGMYWNVLDLFMTWGPQRWVFDIWGDSHIVDYTGYLFCLVLCVCCLLSIGGPNTNKKRQWDMSLVIELVVIQMFQLAVVTWLWINATNQERDAGAVDQQNLSMAINVAYIHKLGQPHSVHWRSLRLRDSFCFLSDRPWSEAKQKVPCSWRSHASSMPPMCPRSRGAGAPVHHLGGAPHARSGLRGARPTFACSFPRFGFIFPLAWGKKNISR